MFVYVVCFSVSHVNTQFCGGYVKCDEMYLRTPLFQLRHQYFSLCTRAAEDYRCRSLFSSYQASPCDIKHSIFLSHPD